MCLCSNEIEDCDDAGWPIGGVHIWGLTRLYKGPISSRLKPFVWTSVIFGAVFFTHLRSVSDFQDQLPVSGVLECFKVRTLVLLLAVKALYAGLGDA